MDQVDSEFAFWANVAAFFIGGPIGDAIVIGAAPDTESAVTDSAAGKIDEILGAPKGMPVMKSILDAVRSAAKPADGDGKPNCFIESCIQNTPDAPPESPLGILDNSYPNPPAPPPPIPSPSAGQSPRSINAPPPN